MKNNKDTFTILEWQEFIQQGYCPYCDTHGWRRLARHTFAKHNISADDIREMAYMLRHKPTCITEESEAMSSRIRQQFKEGRRKPPPHPVSPYTIVLSERGKKSLIDKAVIMRTYISKEGYIESGIKHSKPHDCPVCGVTIPHSKPICCSDKCRRIRCNTGVKSAKTRVHLAEINPTYRLRMAQVPQHEKYKRPHKCPDCGMLVVRSRPIRCDKCRGKQRKPHNCPICNSYIPKSRPLCCSPKCCKIYRREKHHKLAS